jgi:hypothetical protein
MPLRAQFTVPDFAGIPSGGAGASTYTFSQYTFVAEQSSSLASITSPSITTTAGDVAIVWCRSQASTVTSITATDSKSDAFTALTFRTASSPGAAQGSYSLNLAGGSTTFTCTPNVSVAFQAMVVLVYNHSGAAATFDTQTGNTHSSTSTATSPTFSTSTAGLVIMCGSVNGFRTFTAGNIGGSASTLRGVSAASLVTTSDAGCEDKQFVAAQTNITAAITANTLVNWDETVVAFK